MDLDYPKPPHWLPYRMDVDQDRARKFHSKRGELFRWSNETEAGGLRLSYYRDEVGQMHRCIYFKDEAAAFHFKMRWF